MSWHAEKEGGKGEAGREGECDALFFLGKTDWTGKEKWLLREKKASLTRVLEKVKKTPSKPLGEPAN